MLDVYGEAYSCQNNLNKWAKLFKEDRYSSQNKDRPSRPTVTSTPEMVYSVNASILTERRLTIEQDLLHIDPGRAVKIGNTPV